MSEPTGHMELFIGSITVTRGGKTVLQKDVHICRKLVKGEWVDVSPPSSPKKVSSAVVKPLPPTKKGRKRS